MSGFAQDEVIGLPVPGEESMETLPDYPHFTIRFGSSLKLMMDCVDFLNNAESEFSRIDLTSDWKKWKARRPDFSLFYSAIYDTNNLKIAGVLRAVTDGHPIPKPPHRKRIIIDYINTSPLYRSQGLASVLITFANNISMMSDSSIYALALEDSCVYWMSKGFILVENSFLNARINIFPDTHLLTIPGTDDPGDIADLALVESEDDDDDDDDDRDAS